MKILRQSSLSAMELLGCASAFLDSLQGEIQGAMMHLERLTGRPKGGAFAFEMALDRHRYGALLVLDRWASLIHAFDTHIRDTAYAAIASETPGRVTSAENLLGRVNQLLDAAEIYSEDLTEACRMGFHSALTNFTAETEAVQKAATLGPMLPEEYSEARATFLVDLAQR